MKLIKSISENESFAKMANVRVIFDNGGGITLQLGDWAHGYNGNMEQAAEDYLAYLEDGTTEGWEGHEEDAATLEPTLDDIRNGGYRIYDADGISNLMDEEDEDAFWGANVGDFIHALKVS